jgi:hypothetical protein
VGKGDERQTEDQDRKRWTELTKQAAQGKPK